MKHVRPLKPYEIFMANIEAGNEQQLVIKRLVESYSLSIGPTKAYGVICAVATLERIYTKYGYHVLDRTLRLCVGTWEGDIDSLGGNILAGVAKMVVAFGDQLRDETFKEKVGFMSVRQLSRIAKERGAGSLGYAEAMLIAYNRKCRYTLRMTKLHSGTITTEDDFVEENEEQLGNESLFAGMYLTISHAGRNFYGSNCVFPTLHARTSGTVQTCCSCPCADNLYIHFETGLSIGSEDCHSQYDSKQHSR